MLPDIYDIEAGSGGNCLLLRVLFIIHSSRYPTPLLLHKLRESHRQEMLTTVDVQKSIRIVNEETHRHQLNCNNLICILLPMLSVA